MTKQLDQFRSIHDPAFIGFDDLFRKIRELEKPQTGFPPYDIIKKSEEEFVIKLAVAGYSKKQISVTLDSGKLNITGSHNVSELNIQYIYKGIAERDFKRTFTLADTVEVNNVALQDGMLYVYLKNVIPETKKPKSFNID
jgi:molecular chaperone IbpA